MTVAETALACPICEQTIHVGDEVIEDEYAETVHLACWEQACDEILDQRGG